ncbi:hypothetical protein [Coxiella-like endosymbiont]|uniref:hypothetical protein n=1 Tax=Coxiella-like endosymbiont TaxID=1592897 RepID=UPI00272B97BC|nr:hypothetical protein [Coxiella-like endosymbiont]
MPNILRQLWENIVPIVGMIVFVILFILGIFLFLSFNYWCSYWLNHTFHHCFYSIKNNPMEATKEKEIISIGLYY